MRVKEWLCMTMVEDVRAMRIEIIRYTTGTYPGIWLRVFLGVLSHAPLRPTFSNTLASNSPSPAQFALLVKWKGSWRWIYDSKVLTSHLVR